MMSTSRALAVFTLLLTSMAFGVETAPVAPQEAIKYDLKYKFKPGEVIRYNVVDLVSIETTIGGTSQTAQAVSKSVKNWRVEKSETDGHVTFEHSVESIDMRNMMSGRQEVSYDSTSGKEPPPGYEDVAKAVGIPLAVVTIDPRGAVIKRIEKKVQPGAGSTSNQIVMPLPASPIALKHVWAVPQDVTVILDSKVTKKIKSRQRFCLEEVSDQGIATISVETQILTPINDPKIQVQLVQRLSKGQVQFDIKEGRAIGQELNLDQRVLSFHGADSSMHYRRKFTEKLIPAGEKVASLPKAPTVSATGPTADEVSPQE